MRSSEELRKLKIFGDLLKMVHRGEFNVVSSAGMLNGETLLIDYVIDINDIQSCLPRL